jgi:hypothetical protein
MTFEQTTVAMTEEQALVLDVTNQDAERFGLIVFKVNEGITWEQVVRGQTQPEDVTFAATVGLEPGETWVLGMTRLDPGDYSVTLVRYSDSWEPTYNWDVRVRLIIERPS